MNHLAPLRTAAILIVIVALVAAVATLAPPAMQRTVIEALIKLVMVVALAIFVGASGVFSFGHVSFMAIGVYVSAILTLAPARKGVLLDLPPWLEAVQLPWPLALLCGILAAGLVAAITGRAFCRLRGIALPMATFALLVITWVVASNWNEVTGGRQALVGLPRYVGLGTAACAAALAILIAAAAASTRHGLKIRATRENEVAAAATGIDVERERYIAFVLSAMVSGAAGILYGHFVGTITANSYYLDLTFLVLTMLIIGGMRSLTGAVAGVAVVSIVSEVLRTIERGVSLGGDTMLKAPSGLQEIFLAAMLIVILILRPSGLLGDAELGARRRPPME